MPDLLYGLGIAPQPGKLPQDPVAQTKAPVSGLADHLLHQFIVRGVAAIGEEPLAITHLKTPFDSKPLAILVRLQNQQRRVGRNDVKLFRERDNFVLDELTVALLQQVFEMGPRP